MDEIGRPAAVQKSNAGHSHFAVVAPGIESAFILSPVLFFVISLSQSFRKRFNLLDIASDTKMIGNHTSDSSGKYRLHFL